VGRTADGAAQESRSHGGASGRRRGSGEPQARWGERQTARLRRAAGTVGRAADGAAQESRRHGGANGDGAARESRRHGGANGDGAARESRRHGGAGGKRRGPEPILGGTQNRHWAPAMRAPSVNLTW
ncbi:MAG TPA: hypothetical protein QGH10_05935, partial [Armatimonadota bacterium]|nr:hypothetical protein [Armatimonadota bacterium]